MKRCLLYIILSVTPILTMAEKLVIPEADVINTGRIKAGMNFIYKPYKGLSIGLSPEIYVDAFRFENGVSKNKTPLDRINLGLDIGYKFNRYCKLSGAYTLIASYHGGKKSSDYQNYFELKHRVEVNLTGYLPIERWTLSLRERFRVTFRPDSTNYNPKENLFAAMELRTRLKVSYKCFSKPLEPYFYIEMVNPLNENQYITKYLSVQDYWLKKMHYRLGLNWRLDAYSSFTFYCAFEHGIDYDVDLKPKKDIVKITPEVNYSYQLGVYYTLEF